MPPTLVSFAIDNGSVTWPSLSRAPRLGESVLADHQDRVCRQLAGPAAGRFRALPVHRTGEGAVLLDEAVATFECSIFREVEAGDHTIVLLRLHAVSDRHGVAPLVFHRSGFGRIAG